MCRLTIRDYTSQIAVQDLSNFDRLLVPDLGATYSPVTHTTLELVACVSLVLRIALDMAGVLSNYDPGPAGMTLCILIHSWFISTAATNAGITSVVMHTLDRFWRIVYPIHHRTRYRRWMLYVGLVVPWVSGFVIGLLPYLGTTSIINGKCYPTLYISANSKKVLYCIVCNFLAWPK